MLRPKLDRWFHLQRTLQGPATLRLLDWNAYETILGRGEVVYLFSWANEHAAERTVEGILGKTRMRQVRVIRS